FTLSYDASKGLFLDAESLCLQPRTAGYSAIMTINENGANSSVIIQMFNPPGVFIEPGTGAILILIFHWDNTYEAGIIVDVSFDECLVFDEMADPIPSDCSDNGSVEIVLQNGVCDVNCDGVTDLSDSQIIVDVITGDDTQPQHIALADVNEDGTVNVCDLQVVANCISGAGGDSILANMNRGATTLFLPELVITPNATGAYGVDMTNEDMVCAGQIEFFYNSTVGLDFTGVSVSDRLPGYEAVFRKYDSDPENVRVLLLFYAIPGTIDPGAGEILTLNWQTNYSCGNTILDIDKAILADQDASSMEVSINNGSVVCGNCQPLLMPEGWSGVSLYLNPTDPSVEAICQPVTQNLIIMSNLSGVFMPGQGINTILQWDVYSSYAVKFDAEILLSVCGGLLSNNEITLGTGWHYIPVLSSCNVTTEDLFGSVPPGNIEIVQEIASSNVFWPEFQINTLGELMPGKGYQIKVNDEITLLFPDCDNTLNPNLHHSSATPESPWDPLSKTVLTHFVAIPFESTELPGKERLIGAFGLDGTNYGVMQMDNDAQRAFLVMFGDDPATPVQDGFLEGEPLEFRAWYPESKEDVKLDAEFDPNMPNPDLFFGSFGMSSITNMKVSSAGIPGFDGTGQISLRPNPAKDEFLLEVSGYREIAGNITIYKLDGQKVGNRDFKKEQTRIGISNLSLGVYVLMIEINGKTIAKRLVKR
nr:T9SS type A sorting domain-containing protein [Bacteroidota bacterium]